MIDWGKCRGCGGRHNRPVVNRPEPNVLHEVSRVAKDYVCDDCVALIETIKNCVICDHQIVDPVSVTYDLAESFERECSWSSLESSGVDRAKELPKYYICPDCTTIIHNVFSKRPGLHKSAGWRYCDDNQGIFFLGYFLQTIDTLKIQDIKNLIEIDRFMK